MLGVWVLVPDSTGVLLMYMSSRWAAQLGSQRVATCRKPTHFSVIEAARAAVSNFFGFKPVDGIVARRPK